MTATATHATKIITGKPNQEAINLLRRHQGNIMLLGPTGTGKTFLARHFAKPEDLILDGVAECKEAPLRDIEDHRVIFILDHHSDLHTLGDARVGRLVRGMISAELSRWTVAMAVRYLSRFDSVPAAWRRRIGEAIRNPRILQGIATNFTRCATDIEREKVYAMYRLPTRRACGDVGRAMLADVVRYVAGRYGLSESDILGKSRIARVSRARHIVMWVATELLPHHLTLVAIGAAINKDHSSVCHGRERIKAMRLNDDLVRAETDAVRDAVMERSENITQGIQCEEE